MPDRDRTIIGLRPKKIEKKYESKLQHISRIPWQSSLGKNYCFCFLSLVHMMNDDDDELSIGPYTAKA
jgi:hypothetical protein